MLPLTWSPLSHCSLKGCEQAFARVTGGKVNRGTGYGLGIQCVYQFYGPKPYVDKIREVFHSLKTSGLHTCQPVTLAKSEFMSGKEKRG